MTNTIEKEQLEQLYCKDRKSVIAIANILSVNRDTVYRYLKKYNITRDSKYDIEKIRKLYTEENYNIAQLLKELDIKNRQSLYKLLNDFNINNPIKDSITELYKAGLSKTEIADNLKLSKEEVEYNFKHHSIWREKVLDISKKELLALRTDNTLEEIAEKYNCSSRTISEYIKKYNIKLDNRKKYYFDTEQLTNLYYEDQLTMDEIADVYGCCRKTVNNAITDIGLNANIVHKENSLERKIRKFLEKNNITFLQNNRSIIAPKELDFFLPDYDIAIEINGLYWHSTAVNSDKHHIANKYKTCKRLGIHLITIFEDELVYKPEIVYNRLRSLLKISPAEIYARQTSIQSITSRQGIDFLNKYHIQGSGKNTIYLGAFYSNNLVAVMSFSKTSIAKGAAKTEWELNRFASIDNIPGVASKLFKFFERTYNPASIISYADLRWNTGNLYKQLGFTHTHDSSPNYWYTTGKQERKHRFNYTKQKLLSMFPKEDSNQTEQQIAEKHSLYRIYDCGNSVYKWLPPAV